MKTLLEHLQTRRDHTPLAGAPRMDVSDITRGGNDVNVPTSAVTRAVFYEHGWMLPYLDELLATPTENREYGSLQRIPLADKLQRQGDVEVRQQRIAESLLTAGLADPRTVQPADSAEDRIKFMQRSSIIAVSETYAFMSTLQTGAGGTQDNSDAASDFVPASMDSEDSEDEGDSMGEGDSMDEGDAMDEGGVQDEGRADDESVEMDTTPVRTEGSVEERANAEFEKIMPQFRKDTQQLATLFASANDIVRETTALEPVVDMFVGSDLPANLRRMMAPARVRADVTKDLKLSRLIGYAFDRSLDLIDDLTQGTLVPISEELRTAEALEKKATEMSRLLTTHRAALEALTAVRSSDEVRALTAALTFDADRPEEFSQLPLRTAEATAKYLQQHLLLFSQLVLARSAEKHERMGRAIAEHKSQNAGSFQLISEMNRFLSTLKSRILALLGSVILPHVRDKIPLATLVNRANASGSGTLFVLKDGAGEEDGVAAEDAEDEQEDSEATGTTEGIFTDLPRSLNPTLKALLQKSPREVEDTLRRVADACVDLVRELATKGSRFRTVLLPAPAAVAQLMEQINREFIDTVATMPPLARAAELDTIDTRSSMPVYAAALNENYKAMLRSAGALAEASQTVTFPRLPLSAVEEAATWSRTIIYRTNEVRLYTVPAGPDATHEPQTGDPYLLYNTKTGPVDVPLKFYEMRIFDTESERADAEVFFGVRKPARSSTTRTQSPPLFRRDLRAQVPSIGPRFTQRGPETFVVDLTGDGARYKNFVIVLPASYDAVDIENVDFTRANNFVPRAEDPAASGEIAETGSGAERERKRFRPVPADAAPLPARTADTPEEPMDNGAVQVPPPEVEDAAGDEDPAADEDPAEPPTTSELRSLRYIAHLSATPLLEKAVREALYKRPILANHLVYRAYLDGYGEVALRGNRSSTASSWLAYKLFPMLSLSAQLGATTANGTGFEKIVERNVQDVFAHDTLAMHLRTMLERRGPAATAMAQEVEPAVLASIGTTPERASEALSTDDRMDASNGAARGTKRPRSVDAQVSARNEMLVGAAAGTPRPSYAQELYEFEEVQKLLQQTQAAADPPDLATLFGGDENTTFMVISGRTLPPLAESVADSDGQYDDRVPTLSSDVQTSRKLYLLYAHVMDDLSTWVPLRDGRQLDRASSALELRSLSYMQYVEELVRSRRAILVVGGDLDNYTRYGFTRSFTLIHTAASHHALDHVPAREAGREMPFIRDDVALRVPDYMDSLVIEIPEVRPPPRWHAGAYLSLVPRAAEPVRPGNASDRARAAQSLLPLVPHYAGPDDARVPVEPAVAAQLRMFTTKGRGTLRDYAYRVMAVSHSIGLTVRSLRLRKVFKTPILIARSVANTPYLEVEPAVYALRNKTGSAKYEIRHHETLAVPEGRVLTFSVKAILGAREVTTIPQPVQVDALTMAPLGYTDEAARMHWASQLIDAAGHAAHMAMRAFDRGVGVTRRGLLVSRYTSEQQPVYMSDVPSPLQRGETLYYWTPAPAAQLRSAALQVSPTAAADALAVYRREREQTGYPVSAALVRRMQREQINYRAVYLNLRTEWARATTADLRTALIPLAAGYLQLVQRLLTVPAYLPRAKYTISETYGEFNAKRFQRAKLPFVDATTLQLSPVVGGSADIESGSAEIVRVGSVPVVAKLSTGPPAAYARPSTEDSSSAGPDRGTVRWNLKSKQADKVTYRPAAEGRAHARMALYAAAAMLYEVLREPDAAAAAERQLGVGARTVATILGVLARLTQCALSSRAIVRTAELESKVRYDAALWSADTGLLSQVLMAYEVLGNTRQTMDIILDQSVQATGSLWSAEDLRALAKTSSVPRVSAAAQVALITHMATHYVTLLPDTTRLDRGDSATAAVIGQIGGAEYRAKLERRLLAVTAKATIPPPGDLAINRLPELPLWLQVTIPSLRQAYLDIDPLMRTNYGAALAAGRDAVRRYTQTAYIPLMDATQFNVLADGQMLTDANLFKRVVGRGGRATYKYRETGNLLVSSGQFPTPQE